MGRSTYFHLFFLFNFSWPVSRILCLYSKSNFLAFTGFNLSKKTNVSKKSYQSSFQPSFQSNNHSIQSLDKTKNTEMIPDTLKISEDIEKTLQEDPTAFDYDEIYEEIQPNLIKNQNKLQNSRYGYGMNINKSISTNSKPQAKYIENLLQKAKEREMEHQLAIERQNHIENEKYEATFGETEAFITLEYKKQLEVEKKFQEQKQKPIDSDHSTIGMANFYSNLMGNMRSPDSITLKKEDKNQNKKELISSQKNNYNNDYKEIDTRKDLESFEDEKSQELDNSLKSPKINENQQIEQNSQNLNQILVYQRTRRNNDVAIEAAKQRYFLRKQQNKI